MKNCLLWIMLSLAPLPLFALEKFYPFNNTLNEQRFLLLTTELRCLVCQNQTLAESNAPLAVDLRKQIYLQINHGKSDRDIINFLVSRYGSFILYQPPFNRSTLFLWIGPFLFLGLCLGILFYYLGNKENHQ